MSLHASSADRPRNRYAVRLLNAAIIVACVGMIVLLAMPAAFVLMLCGADAGMVAALMLLATAAGGAIGLRVIGAFGIYQLFQWLEARKGSRVLRRGRLPYGA